jgi:excisionase family DNA binding protein
MASDQAIAVFGERLFTAKEVALLFGIKVTTVREWITRGELLAIRVGKEYRVSETALRKYKEEKEQQAEIERAEKLMMAELARRRDRDPAVYWDITNCLNCGYRPKFTTRAERLLGDVFCGICAASVRTRDPDGLLHFLRTRDTWERMIALQTAEYNAIAGVAPGDVPRYWLYHCGICSRPQMLERDNIVDLMYYPNCDHAPPFIGAEDEVHQRDMRVVRAMAALEPLIRLQESSIGRDGRSDAVDSADAWAMTRCVYCGTDAAVTSRVDRLVGAGTCRACYGRSPEPWQFQRVAGMVIAELKQTHPSYACQTRRCACGRTEIITADDQNDGVLVSWCLERNRDDRNAMFIEYARQFLCPGEPVVPLELTLAHQSLIQHVYDLPV